MEGKMTLFGLSAQMAQIEDELYENGGELTPELEKELTETRESLVAKVDGYNALYQKLGAMAASAKAEADRLTVIAPAEDCDKEHGYRWIVRCDCGTTFTAYRGNLASGMTRSCGCLRRETMLKNRRNRK